MSVAFANNSSYLYSTASLDIGWAQNFSFGFRILRTEVASNPTIITLQGTIGSCIVYFGAGTLNVLDLQDVGGCNTPDATPLVGNTWTHFWYDRTGDPNQQ